MNTEAEQGLSGRDPEVYLQWARALVASLRHSAPTDEAHAEALTLLSAVAHEAQRTRTMTRDAV